MNTLRWAREHTLLSLTERTADGISNIINAGEYSSALFFITASVVTGADATLKATLQMSPDNETWFDSEYKISDLTLASKQILAVPALGRYVRFNYTIEGTDPHVTFNIVGAFKS